MEDFIADIKQHFLELQSGIVVLNRAITNEFEEVSKEEIHNYLTVLTDKMDLIIKSFDKVESLYDSSIVEDNDVTIL